MGDQGDVHVPGQLPVTLVAQALTVGTFLFHVVEGNLTLDHHLGVGGHQEVVGLALHDLHGAPAQATGNSQLIHGLVALAIGRTRTADHIHDGVLAKDQRNARRLLAPLLRCGQHLPAGLAGAGADGHLAWPLELAAIGAQVHAGLGVDGEDRGRIDVAATVAGIDLHEREAGEVDLVALQDDLLAGGLFTGHQHGRNLRIPATIFRGELDEVGPGLAEGCHATRWIGLQAESQAFRVPWPQVIAHDRALQPFAPDLHILEEQGWRPLQPVLLDQPVHEGRALIGILVDALDAQHAAPGFESPDHLPHAVEGA